jgi:uncharacterized protein YlxP (DUF503 family)
MHDNERIVQAFQDIANRVLKRRNPIELGQEAVIGLAAIMAAMGGIERQLERIADHIQVREDMEVWHPLKDKSNDN